MTVLTQPLTDWLTLWRAATPAERLLFVGELLAVAAVNAVVCWGTR